MLPIPALDASLDDLVLLNLWVCPCSIRASIGIFCFTPVLPSELSIKRVSKLVRTRRMRNDKVSFRFVWKNFFSDDSIQHVHVVLVVTVELEHIIY